MHLQTITIEEFTKFQLSHPLSNYFQTINYAILMSECGYDYELVGYKDENDNLLAASLVLLKPIGVKCFYGYAPRGFLIDYENEDLLRNFTLDIKKYFYEKNVIFIKVNPNFIVGELDKKSLDIINTEKSYVKDLLIRNDYKKLKDNLYFEAKEPRFEGVIDLKNFDISYLSKNTRNKIKKSLRKGLTFEKCDKDLLHVFYNFVKDKDDYNDYYYQDLFTTFSKNDDIDLFLVSINYNDFLQNSEYLYNLELDKNSKLNEKLINNNYNKVINAKMQSDKNLLSYKNDIMEATKYLNINEKIYIAGALVIKHNNTASIVSSGYNKDFKRFVPNYFLYYSLIKYYFDLFDYLNIGGLVGDFKNENKYSGLNTFKLGYSPDVYEYIGEYDLIIEPKSYQILLENGILAKEFNKKS